MAGQNRGLSGSEVAALASAYEARARGLRDAYADVSLAFVANRAHQRIMGAAERIGWTEPVLRAAVSARVGYRLPFPMRVG